MGGLWYGCPVNVDKHTYVHKRKGFPAGTYTFTVNKWDDEARIFIDGVNMWSCSPWYGSGSISNSNGSPYSCNQTFTVTLGPTSEVEIQTFEGILGSRVEVDIKDELSSLTTAGIATKTCNVEGYAWFDFIDQDKKLIASINPNGDTLGNVTMTSYVGSPMVMNDCSDPTNSLYHTAYMGRRWKMTSDLFPNGINFNNNVSVRLPYNTSELATLNTTAQTLTTGNLFDGGTSDPPATRSNLMLTKMTGSTEDGVATLADCSETIRGVLSVGSGTNILSISNTEYVEFYIQQFSEFFLHKSKNNSPLPVTLIDFSVSCDDLSTTLNWTTSTEHNSAYFVIEKSRNGQDWAVVGKQNAAGNSTSIKKYNIIDNDNSKSTVYYRLRQVDFDGKETIYGPITGTCTSDKNELIVYPNPNEGSFMVKVLNKNMNSDAQLTLTDLTGKKICSKNHHLSLGSNLIELNDLNLSNGAYFITLRNANVVLKPIKVIVSK